MSIINEYCKSSVFRRKTADFSIFKKLTAFAGTINKSPWLGGCAETWLCSSPGAVKEGAVWIITCIFFKRDTGWNQVPLVNGGWVYKKVYRKKEFAALGFSEKDFLDNDPA